jgi:hypothetical protein
MHSGLLQLQHARLAQAFISREVDQVCHPMWCSGLPASDQHPLPVLAAHHVHSDWSVADQTVSLIFRNRGSVLPLTHSFSIYRFYLKVFTCLSALSLTVLRLLSISPSDPKGTYTLISPSIEAINSMKDVYKGGSVPAAAARLLPGGSAALLCWRPPQRVQRSPGPQQAAPGSSKGTQQ